MYKELKEALKSDVAAVRAGKPDNGSSWRRHTHLALCYLRGTPYRKCEADPRSDPSSTRIEDILKDYGFGREAKRVVDWLGYLPVKEKPVKIRKLYVVVRADLPPGAQAVQAAHAMREFAHRYPEIENEWHQTSNTVAFLAVPNETELLVLANRLEGYGISLAEFREPDMHNLITAVCFEPKAGGLLRGLPLALKEKSAQQESNLPTRV